MQNNEEDNDKRNVNRGGGGLRPPPPLFRLLLFLSSSLFCNYFDRVLCLEGVCKILLCPRLYVCTCMPEYVHPTSVRAHRAPKHAQPSLCMRPPGAWLCRSVLKMDFASYGLDFDETLLILTVGVRLRRWRRSQTRRRHVKITKMRPKEVGGSGGSPISSFKLEQI